MHHTSVACLQEHCPLGLTTHLVSSGWALGKLPQPRTLQRVRLEARGSGMSEGVGGTVPTDGATCRGHSPVPGGSCWGDECLHPPQTGCAWGVGVYSPANVKLGPVDE